MEVRGGFELEPSCGRERSGTPQAKSRAQRGTSVAYITYWGLDWRHGAGYRTGTLSFSSSNPFRTTLIWRESGRGVSDRETIMNRLPAG